MTRAIAWGLLALLLGVPALAQSPYAAPPYSTPGVSNLPAQAAALTVAQPAGYVLAAPTGGGIPTFRPLTTNDVPGSGAGSSGVSAFNARTGAITLLSTDVTTALGYTPYNASNPSNYITAANAPVQTVAGRAGTVTLVAADIGGLTAPATAAFGTTTGTVADGGALAAKANTASPTFTGTTTTAVIQNNGILNNNGGATLFSYIQRVASLGATGTGTAQTGATAIPNSRYLTIIGSCATGATAFVLPGGAVGSNTFSIKIDNRSGNACLLFPPSGGTIENGTLNASVTLASGSDTVLDSTSTSNWNE